MRATPRLSKARRLRRRKSASSPKARPNREAEPKAFLALLRMVSPAVTPIVASPSVKKMTSGTRLGVRCLREEDEGLISWAAESRAALILVPVIERMEDNTDNWFKVRVKHRKWDDQRVD